MINCCGSALELARALAFGVRIVAALFGDCSTAMLGVQTAHHCSASTRHIAQSTCTLLIACEPGTDRAPLANLELRGNVRGSELKKAQAAAALAQMLFDRRNFGSRPFTKRLSLSQTGQSMRPPLMPIVLFSVCLS